MDEARREAKRKYMAEWYQKNKERLSVERKEYLAAYYQANKERASELARDYQDKNRAAITERRRVYRQTAEAKALRSAWVDGNKELVRAYKKADRKRNPDTKRNYDFITKYGITLDDYDEMLDKQGGLCAICFRPPNAGRRMAVDHNHDTGAIRGLLCSTCNLALGHFQDSPSVVASAFAYLEAYGA